MAKEGEEGKAIEEQLEAQLQEQKDSLSDIKLALLSDPTNSELLSVEEELVSSINDAEEGLLGLKRVRLLCEADAMQSLAFSSKDVVAEPIASADMNGVRQPCKDVEADSLYPSDDEVETVQEPSYRVGSKCRFRHTDGRWYIGGLVELDGSSARVSFLTPTTENMMSVLWIVQCPVKLFVRPMQ